MATLLLTIVPSKFAYVGQLAKILFITAPPPCIIFPTSNIPAKVFGYSNVASQFQISLDAIAKKC